MKKTDPTELMKKHDEAIRIENALSGLSEDGIGVANPGKHYIQFIEAKYPTSPFMYANNYLTGYAEESIEFVLDIEKFTKDGWDHGMKWDTYISRYLGYPRVWVRRLLTFTV